MYQLTARATATSWRHMRLVDGRAGLTEVNRRRNTDMSMSRATLVQKHGHDINLTLQTSREIDTIK